MQRLKSLHRILLLNPCSEPPRIVVKARLLSMPFWLHQDEKVPDWRWWHRCSHPRWTTARPLSFHCERLLEWSTLRPAGLNYPEMSHTTSQNREVTQWARGELLETLRSSMVRKSKQLLEQPDYSSVCSRKRMDSTNRLRKMEWALSASRLTTMLNWQLVPCQRTDP